MEQKANVINFMHSFSFHTDKKLKIAFQLRRTNEFGDLLMVSQTF